MIRFDCRLERPGFRFDVAFEAGPGVTALFGASGSGKSTAIRLLAGLERPDDGSISFFGEPVTDTSRAIFVAAHRRRVGLVFQDALLLPHLSVEANLHYGRWFTPHRERRLEPTPVIAALGIGHLLSRRPGSLSGGERQRVAIGRAMMASPRMLLMDEPLASLDEARKQEILPFIERLRDEFGIPIIYVSHSVEEVMRLAARVVRLEGGRVRAAGLPGDALGPSLVAPAGRFEAISVLNGVAARYLPQYRVTEVAHPAGDIIVPGELAPGRTVRVAIRSSQVSIAVGDPGLISIRTVLKGRISAIDTDDGPFAVATIALAGGDALKAFVSRLGTDGLGLKPGDAVQALVKAASIDERGISSN